MWKLEISENKNYLQKFPLKVYILYIRYKDLLSKIIASGWNLFTFLSLSF